MKFDLRAYRVGNKKRETPACGSRVANFGIEIETDMLPTNYRFTKILELVVLHSHVHLRSIHSM